MNISSHIERGVDFAQFRTWDFGPADALPTGDGYCYDNCEPRVIEYEQGTIVLDVVDTHTNRVVWRGWAQDSIDGVIDKQESLRKEVNTAVTRMMELFPRHL